MACWWHRVPRFKLENPELSDEELKEKKQRDLKYGHDLIDKEFKNTILLLKNSISDIEDVQNVPVGPRKDALLSLLDQNSFIPPNHKDFVATHHIFHINKLILYRKLGPSVTLWRDLRQAPFY